jgi:SAM-dependent methyltransferase
LTATIDGVLAEKRPGEELKRGGAEMENNQVETARRPLRWHEFVYARFFRLAGKLRLKSVYHRVVDKFEGIDSAGSVLQSEAGFDSAKGNKYAPGGWWDLKMTLGEKVSADDVFIDFGSGKGRMVYLAARYFPFRKVIGVEISGKLNEIAGKNIEKNRHRLRSQDIQLVTGNILDYVVGDDITVVYMYNPFGGSAFGELIDKLCASLNRCPREMRIIYRNPVMHDCLIKNGFAVAMKMDTLILYSWKPGPELPQLS